MTGDYGISLGYEKDKCSVCGIKKEVRIVYNKVTKRSANICDNCAETSKDLTTEELIKKYGKKIRTKAQIKKADEILKVD
jgi:hypothetical protein